MFSIQEIVTIADARREDAHLLAKLNRTDGAFYIAGYAVELLLKARIAFQLGIPDLFSDTSDKELVKPFKIHDLNRLLKYSGLYPNYLNDRQTDETLLKGMMYIFKWNESARYKSVGSLSEIECIEFLKNVDYFCLWIKKHI